MTSLLLILGGFVLLLGGGEVLVRGAVGMAARLGLSPTVIGLTVVGFGTSMPELLTSLSAAVAGSPGIAVGNVVGSNIANVLLILGAAALLAPVTGDRSLTRDLVAMAGASLLLLAVVLTGALGRLSGLALIAGLAVYLWLVFRSAPDDGADDLPPAPSALPLAISLFAGGLLVTVIGARLLVSGAVDIAGALGVPEVVIGLTIVAVGTSLPELVTSLIAARKGESGLALGNVIGSNIFNLLGRLQPPDRARADRHPGHLGHDRRSRAALRPAAPAVADRARHGRSLPRRLCRLPRGPCLAGLTATERRP